MKIALTTPRILGYRLYFETLKYSPAGRLLDCYRDECDTEVWLLGLFYIVISNEREI